MGVTGLWGILEPAGKPTRIQSLRGKVLAVDASIWLHQSVKGFRDRDGNPIRNAHLLGIFHRVCKLLSNGIKPVFVFDGGVPVLKKQTMAGRRKRKIEAMDKSQASRKKLIQNLLRTQLQRQYLTDMPPAAEIEAEVDRILKTVEKSEGTGSLEPETKRRRSKSTTPKKKGTGEEAGFEDDFEKFREKLAENYNNFSIFLNEMDEFSDEDSESGEEKVAAAFVKGYDENFDAIISPSFDELPLEVQHEMLYEMQESRKNNSWGKMDQMPKGLQSFSSFQMERLRKRRTLQKKIQSVQKEMGQRHIHLSNFDDLAAFNYEDIPEHADSKDVLVAKKKETGIIYVKSTAATGASQSQEEIDEKPGPSIKTSVPVETLDIIESSSSDDEDKLTEEQELQRAIELSLQDQHIKEGQDSNDYEGNEKTRDSVEAAKTKFDDVDDEEYEGENEAVVAAAQFVKDLAKAAQEKAAAIGEETNTIELEDKPSDIASVVDLVEEEEEKATAVECAGADEDEDEEEDFEDVESTVTDQSEAPKEPKPVLTIEFSKDDKFEEEDDIFADIFGPKNEPKEEAQAEDEVIEIAEDDQTDQVEEVAAAEPTREEEEEDSDLEFAQVEMPVEELLEEESEESRQEEPAEEKKIKRTLGTDPTKPVKMISAKYMQAQEKLNKEKEELKSVAGFQERVATSITDQMNTEAQELLALFGVPYVVSPMEAESQCAFLDTACLTEGTITDDSDVWLFGGQRVYKNFFSQGDRPLLLYEYADVVQKLNLDREKLIVIALLTGSDYTDGVEGVGPVKALEILSEFPSKSVSAFGILTAFRDWWEEAQKNKKLDHDNKIRSKLRTLKLRPGFPNISVWNEYMNPTIDESLEQFRWGTPDLEALRSYTRSMFGWNQQKADAALLPLIKSLNKQPEESRRQQLTLDSFLQIGKLEKNLESHGVKRRLKSKRLQQAMKKLKEPSQQPSGQPHLSDPESSSDSESPEQSQPPVHTPPTESINGAVSNDKNGTDEDKELDELLVKMGVKRMRVNQLMRASGSSRNAANSSGRSNSRTPRKGPLQTSTSSASSSSNSSPVLRPEPVVRSPIPITPTKPQVIPQRAREEHQRELNKKKAIELLKNKKK